VRSRKSQVQTTALRGSNQSRTTLVLICRVTLSGSDRSGSHRLSSPRGELRLRDESISVGPSPTELNFPLEPRKRHHHPESLYDDPRSPYHGHPAYSTPPRPLTPTPRGVNEGAQRHLGLASQLSGHLRSEPASWEDPLPFPQTRSPGNSSEGNSYKALSGMYGGNHNIPSPRDRDVKAMLYQASPGALRRLARSGVSDSQPIRPKSMALGPAGSGRVAVAASDGE
jgi:hypothetical protein